MLTSLAPLRRKMRALLAIIKVSRDSKTLRVLIGQTQGLESIKIRFCKKDLDLYIRGQTSDVELVRYIFRDRGIYAMPKVDGIDTILDVGANIGLTALYFASQFPQASIYAFEPFPENYELLEKNTSNHPQIHTFPYGLSAKDGDLAYCFSDNPRNFGGGTFKAIGCDTQKKFLLPVKSPKTAIRDLGLGEIDLIKIDTEGSEFDILRNIDTNILEKVKLVTGELHGIDDFKVLDLLSNAFDLALEKSINHRCFNFLAINKHLQRS